MAGMRLGLHFGYHQWDSAANLRLAREAEALGFHSLWTAEAWGLDAVTPLSWLAAHTSRIQLGTGILQISSRTPALAAMTAVTLDLLSGGRFLLGLGVSGPQVVEGWHGVPFARPLERTREYVQVIRLILRREAPLQFRGKQYTIPYPGSGLGKPLKIMTRPLREHIPIYLAALGPKNVALAGEIADGWMPVFFSPRQRHLFYPHLEEGFQKAGGGKSLGVFDVAPLVYVAYGKHLPSCRAQIKPILALYVGGMGAPQQNFYNRLVTRYGYGDAARKIQDLYLSGRQSEAVAAVPDALVDEVCLCGPREVLAERLQEWKEGGVGTLICATNQIEALRVLAELVA